jgi:hypothetical protein
MAEIAIIPPEMPPARAPTFDLCTLIGEGVTVAEFEVAVFDEAVFDVAVLKVELP